MGEIVDGMSCIRNTGNRYTGTRQYNAGTCAYTLVMPADIRGVGFGVVCIIE